MKLGIDIGVDTARAAFLDQQQQPQLVHVTPSQTTLPALVRQTMHGIQVGESAARALIGNAETTLVGCVRLMGGRATWPPQMLEQGPFEVYEHAGRAVCRLPYAELPAVDAYAALLQTLITAAEVQTGAKVESVVLTVPAGAEHRFRVAAREAAEQLGYHVQRLLNQPTAALLAAPLPSTAQRVAVVNCGIGSVDVTIADCSGDLPKVLSTVSDMVFGRDQLAWTVVDHLAQRFQQLHGFDVLAADFAGFARAGLKLAVDEALLQFQALHQVELVLDHGAGFGRDLATLLRRSDVDQWIAPHTAHLRLLCEQAMARIGFGVSGIDTVLLIGEAAEVPMFHQTVAQAFARPVSAVDTRYAQTLAVCGAALASTHASNLLWDVTPYPLGINCYFGDEELLSTLIKANTSVPTPPPGTAQSFTQSYQTRFPDQTSVRLDLLQYRGLRTPGVDKVFPHECEVLDSWTFSGLRPTSGRCAAFTVTFSIDEHGIVHLSAVETATGHRLDVQSRRSL